LGGLWRVRRSRHGSPIGDQCWLEILPDRHMVWREISDPRGAALVTRNGISQVPDHQYAHARRSGLRHSRSGRSFARVTPSQVSQVARHPRPSGVEDCQGAFRARCSDRTGRRADLHAGRALLVAADRWRLAPARAGV